MAAHKLEEERTDDVVLDRNCTFAQMLLPDPVLKGLTAAGYVYPSAIQKKGIPIGRCGHDILVQSKSGTGKTLVFSIISLEKFDPSITHPQTLILCPTREIAVQTAETLKTIGKFLPKFKTGVVIGGLSVQDNRKDLQDCSVVVGTPGRIQHLIELNVLNTKHINLLILDEVDLLLAANFNLDDIRATLPKPRLQVVSVSATLDDKAEKKVKKFMKNPIGISSCAQRDVPVLLGIGQFVCRLGGDAPGLEMLRKFEKLKEILSKVNFKQCFVFTNSQSLAESYKKLLALEQWPSEVITGAYEQEQRLKVLGQLKEYKIRVLLSTDLMARGIDAENVNLVVNMDVPRNGMVYLHRIGRAGRFGTKGIAVTLVATEEQEKEFEKIQEQYGLKNVVMEMPKEIECKAVWEMVERTSREKVQEEKTEVEDTLALLLDSNVNFEDISNSVQKEEDDDPLSLLLDEPSSVKPKEVAERQSREKKMNILEEFEKFSESQNVPEITRNGDTVSMDNHVDSEEELPELPEKEEKNRSNNKKRRNKENCESIGLATWKNLFDSQYTMISEYVNRNNQGFLRY